MRRGSLSIGGPATRGSPLPAADLEAAFTTLALRPCKRFDRISSAAPAENSGRTSIPRRSQFAARVARTRHETTAHPGRLIGRQIRRRLLCRTPPVRNTGMKPSPCCVERRAPASGLRCRMVFTAPTLRDSAVLPQAAASPRAAYGRTGRGSRKEKISAEIIGLLPNDGEQYRQYDQYEHQVVEAHNCSSFLCIAENVKLAASAAALNPSSSGILFSSCCSLLSWRGLCEVREGPERCGGGGIRTPDLINSRNFNRPFFLRCNMMGATQSGKKWCKRWKTEKKYDLLALAANETVF